MFKAAASIAVIAGLAVASPALAEQKPPAHPPARQMGWFGQTVRSIVVFHSCTERLKEKFNIGPLNGVEVTNMDTAGAHPDGPMDVKFEATTTEKKSGRKSRFVGVCHVGAEGETRIDARLVSQTSGGEVRRVAPGKVSG
jgi:hypothetical protein